MWTFKWHRKHECSNATKCQTVFATDPTGLGRKVVVKLIEKPLNVEEALKIDCWHARMRKPGYGSLVPGSFSNRCRRTVFFALNWGDGPVEQQLCAVCPVSCASVFFSMRQFGHLPHSTSKTRRNGIHQYIFDGATLAPLTASGTEPLNRRVGHLAFEVTSEYGHNRRAVFLNS